MCRRRTRAAAGIATVATLLPLGAGCLLAPRPLRVPISNWPGYELVHLASELGLDRRHGLRIEPVAYPNPQAIVHAYLRGELPIAQLTTVEAVDLCARLPRRCPVVVLVLDESVGGDQLAVHNGIASIAALRGHTVAVTFSTLGPYVLHRALELHGVDFAAVSVRHMTLDQMPRALARGELQATAFFPPFSEIARRDGRSRVLFDSRRIPGEIFDVLVVDPAFLRHHRSELVALISSWQEALEAIRKDRSRSVAIMASRERLSPAEFDHALRGLHFFPLRQQVAMLAAQGAIAANLRAVQKVQQRLGLSLPSAPLPPSDAGPVREALAGPGERNALNSALEGRRMA